MTRENLHIKLAVLLSLLLHAVPIVGSQHPEWLGYIPWLRPLEKVFTVRRPVVARPKSPEQTTITFVQATEPERPKHFMETDATQVTGPKPPSTDYYSDRSTVVANPVNPTGKTADTPYLAGKETRMVSTETVVPGPPSPPAARPVPKPQPVSPPKPVAPAPKPVQVAAEGLKMVEEMKVAKAEPVVKPPVPEPVEAPTPPAASAIPSPGNPRREIAAIQSRMTATGAGRIGVAAFNVAESPFGAYDKMLIRAVQSRWYRLIEQNGLYERAGEVRVHFQLMDDGTVQGVQTKENTAGSILALFCEKAIIDSAPFEPLTDELRALVGKEPREVDFTFYY